MFKKFINRNEGSQVEINDSVLRDIIPSNDAGIPKKPRHKRFSAICKILILIFVLGLIAIGIVVLALVLTFSGKSFLNYIIHTPTENLLRSSNRTRALTVHQENFTTSVLDKQDWEKRTAIPTNNNQSISTIIDEQFTSTPIETTEENRIITTETFTSTFSIKTDSETIPLTTEIVSQSSTNQNKKENLLAKYKRLEEDDIIDDFLYL